jgi:hypothetical protein
MLLNLINPSWHFIKRHPHGRKTPAMSVKLFTERLKNVQNVNAKVLSWKLHRSAARPAKW